MAEGPPAKLFRAVRVALRVQADMALETVTAAARFAGVVASCRLNAGGRTQDTAVVHVMLSLHAEQLVMALGRMDRSAAVPAWHLVFSSVAS